MIVDQRMGVSVDDLTNAAASQKVVREAELDCAHFIEARELLVAEIEIQRGQVVLDLRQLSDADDGNDDAAVRSRSVVRSSAPSEYPLAHCALPVPHGSWK